MKGNEYGPLNVTIRAQENKLLKQGHFDRMIAADNFDDAVNILRETVYRNDVDDIKVSRDYDNMLMHELERVYEDMFVSTPNKKLIELAALRYSYHNLKVLFKEKYLESDLSDLYINIGRYDISELREAVRTNQSDVLPNEYLRSIHEVNLQLDETHLPHAIDIILDRHYFEHLHSLALEIGEKDIIDLTNQKADFYNISTAIRATNQGRTRNFLNSILTNVGTQDKDRLVSSAGLGKPELERFLKSGSYKRLLESATEPDSNELSAIKVDYITDNAYMKKIQEAKLLPFGPLPTIAYLQAKETEVTNLRLVLAGKENGIESDVIRERMRLNYGQ